MEKMIINGVTYVREDEVTCMAEKVEGMQFCIIRTHSAGVHAGYVKSRDGKEVTLANARRIWKWAGAFTLSELAVKGSENETECRFSCTVPEIILTEAIEIIPCTQVGEESIMRVKDYEC